MIIELESGHKLEVPDGSTPDQIDEVASHFQSNMQSKPTRINPDQQPGFYDTSVGRTTLEQGMQGATFAASDEIMNPLAAVAAGIMEDPKAFFKSVFTGKTPEVSPGLTEELVEGRQNTKGRMAAQIRERPALSIGSNIGGALLTGGAGATTKTGAAIGNSLRAGNALARIGKGALAGAASGAAYGAGAADEGQRLEGAGEGAIYGAVAGGAIPAVGAIAGATGKGAKNALRGMAARSPEVLQDTAGAMKSSAGKLYDQMRQAGAVLNPSTSNGLLMSVDAAVKQNKFIPALNPKTVGILDDLAETIRGNGGKIGLDELDQYRRLLSRVGASEDGVSAGAARRAIDNIVDGLQGHSLANGNTQAISLLKQGRAAYKQATKFEDVADILARADGDPNKIKAGLSRFLNSHDGKPPGYSTQEIAALKSAAKSTAPEKILKMFGKFGIDLGTSFTPGNTIGPVVGGYMNPLIPAGGTAARQTQKYLARGKAENLLRALEGKLPQGNGRLPIAPLGSAPAGGAAARINSMPQSSNMPLPVQGNAVPGLGLISSAQASETAPPSETPLVSRVLQQESRNRDFDKNGNILQGPPTKYGRAEGAMQVLPMTQRDPGYGVRPAKDKSSQELRRVGYEYLNAMLAKYAGNEALALMAYNWGPGNVDKWIKKGGKPQAVPRETRNYVANILNV